MTVYLLYHRFMGEHRLQQVTISEDYAKRWVETNPDYLYYVSRETYEGGD